MRRWIAPALLLLLAACHYDFALTDTPTRAADSRLAGTWTLVEPEQGERMDVRLYDDRNYVIAYNGDLYRAFHSEVAGLPLISAQNLNDRERKWIYFTWQLSEDGRCLTIRAVRTEVVPATTRDRAAVVKLIEANRENPTLFGEAGVYTK